MFESIRRLLFQHPLIKDIIDQGNESKNINRLSLTHHPIRAPIDLGQGLTELFDYHNIVI